jgi:hypothetical protein
MKRLTTLALLAGMLSAPALHSEEPPADAAPLNFPLPAAEPARRRRRSAGPPPTARRQTSMATPPRMPSPPLPGPRRMSFRNADCREAI